MRMVSIFLPLIVVIFDLKVKIIMVRKTIVRNRRQGPGRFVRGPAHPLGMTPPFAEDPVWPPLLCPTAPPKAIRRSRDA